MRKLLNIEFIKLANYTSFKVILLLHLVLFSMVIFISSRITISMPGFDTANFFRFPYVWNYFAWIASWFNLLLAISAIMVTGNEFSYRTFRQHVIDGLGKKDLLWGKLLVIFIIAAYGSLLVFFSGTVYGMIYTPELTAGKFFSGTAILMVYFLQAFAYMVVGLLIVMVVRSTALPIILFILLRFPVEPIIRSFFDPSVRRFFPMKAIGNLTPMPEFLSISSQVEYETTGGANALTLEEMGLTAPGLPLFAQILLATGYIVIFLSAIIIVLKKRDI